MQYTLRKIPTDVDRALRAQARRLGKSVNQVAIEALARSLDLPKRYRHLREMPGAWSKKEAAAFDEFLAGERVVDEELWK